MEGIVEDCKSAGFFHSLHLFSLYISNSTLLYYLHHSPLLLSLLFCSFRIFSWCFLFTVSLIEWCYCSCWWLPSLTHSFCLSSLLLSLVIPTTHSVSSSCVQSYSNVSSLISYSQPWGNSFVFSLVDSSSPFFGCLAALLMLTGSSESKVVKPKQWQTISPESQANAHYPTVPEVKCVCLLVGDSNGMRWLIGIDYLIPAKKSLKWIISIIPSHL